MYAAHLYDAVILYANALGATLKEKNLTEPADIIEAAKDGRSLFKHIIRDRKYDSKSIRLLSHCHDRSMTCSWHLTPLI